MRSASLIVAASALWLAAAPAAWAGVEFGEPDYPNYLTPPGRGTCDWWTSAWLRACPGVLATPTAAAPVAAAKVKKGKASKAAQ
jgi:hypothetical protein